MSLPQQLKSYEFERRLIPSTDMDRLIHLKVICDHLGTPLLAPDEKQVPLDLNDFMGSPDPLEIEIGCGKGNFMQEYCEKFPNKPFLGIDQEGAIAFFAAQRMAKRKQLQNYRVIFGDAYYFFRDFLPENSVAAFHMYFPDPWPKKRHRKRRLLNKPFLEEIHRIATPDAKFYWGTDFQNYHEESMEIFNETPWLQIEIENAGPTEGIETNFEKKYRIEGRPIYRTQLKIVK